MTFSRIETAFDRIAPTFLLALGLIAADRRPGRLSLPTDRDG